MLVHRLNPDDPRYDDYLKTCLFIINKPQSYDAVKAMLIDISRRIKEVDEVTNIETRQDDYMWALNGKETQCDVQAHNDRVLSAIIEEYFPNINYI